MMDANQVIDSYVRDVAQHLPRSRRNDVALELHALLHEELAARAAEAGQAPDRTMALSLLRTFGRPADTAQRYHARSALVDAADTRHFLVWAVGGLVVLAMHATLNPHSIDVGALFLQWLGTLLLCFAALGWWRRRYPASLAWSPSRGPEWMPRALALFCMLAFLVFPVAMYAQPVAFARALLPDAVAVDGMMLADAFAGSWQRALTLALLVALPLLYAVATVLGSRPAWLRRVDVVIELVLGLMLIAHGSWAAGGEDAWLAPFRSAHANAVAAPIFTALGGMMVLVCLYYAWRERTHIDLGAPPAGASTA